MKIIYVIYNEWTIQQKILLQNYGFFVEEGYGRIEVEENTRNREVLKLLDSWNLRKSVGTIYEKEDYDRSSLFVYVGLWENGYPMPDSDGSYKRLTYSLDSYCEICGIGKIQKSPFRIRKEPKWGNKMMFELNWIYDEIFVRKEFYDSFFENIGIEYWPVLHYKKEEIIENAVQLKVPVISTPLNLENQPFDICKICGRKKYSPQIKGFFPGFTQPVNELNIFKCGEYFGSGAQAYNKIFISKEIWKGLTELKINPKLYPVTPYS